MSLLERTSSREGRTLESRLDALGSDAPATTIVSYEEQIRGWMSILSSATSMAKQIDAYQKLLQQLRNYCSFKVLAFDDAGAVAFQRLKSLKPRLGTLDLKIAAIVISRNAMLLSRNLRDFKQIPGLQVEDWTQE